MFYLLMLSLPLSAQQKAKPVLTLAKPQLLDGTHSTSIASAPQSRLRVRFTLFNRSAGALVLWDPTNTEGMGCGSLLLTDVHGRPIPLQPIPFPRAAGVPTAITVPTGKSFSYDFDFARLVASAALPPGKYTVAAVYENTLRAAGRFTDVWTGRIVSPAAHITIDAPGSHRSRSH